MSDTPRHSGDVNAGRQGTEAEWPLPRGQFNTTHWTVILTARDANSPQAANALAELCSAYWYPLYAYIRRQGHDAHKAQDLTQEFFARLLQKNLLDCVRRERGKFRWFLLSALKRFLINEWEYEHAAKRGGKQSIVSLDEERAEGCYRQDVADHRTPEKLFDQNWAMTLLKRAERELLEEYAGRGQGVLFHHLKVFLSGDRAPVSHADAGAALNMSEGAVKVAVHRMRQRYRECLREQIAHTVSSPAEVNEEIRQLLSVFA